MRDAMRGIRLCVSAAFRADARLAWGGFVLEPLGYMAPPLVAYATKRFVDAAAAADRDGVVRAVVLLVVLQGATFFLATMGYRLRMRMRERTGVWFEERLIDLAANIPGVEHHERADYADRMDLLRERAGGLGATLTGISYGIGQIARMSVTVVLLATLHPLLVVLPVFGVASVYAEARAQRRLEAVRELNAERVRRSQHLFALATEPGAGKELRVFGLGDLVLARYRDERERINADEERASTTSALWQALGWVVFSAGWIAAIVFVVWNVSEGRGTGGDVLLAIILAAMVNQNVEGIGGSISWVMGTLKAAEHYLWLEDYALAARPAAGGHPVPERIAGGITLDRVTFRYPGTDVDVLNDVSLSIPAGCTLAIVGDNGAGKTTLVKLLCGFYRPTLGTITADGVDLAEFEPRAWRERLAGGFQDFCRFEFLARETVGLGDVPRIQDGAVVLAALDRAGGTDVPPTLPGGLETQLGKQWEGGSDLSTGQWQKLALGRAMMREHPLLLVLDEPTASLDAKTEFALFQRYGEAARARAAEGGITVLVSHRFSTVRAADMIVVIDGGRVIETGTHAELMARGGRYCELFTLQAAAYR